MPGILVLERPKEENLEFEASLEYIENLGQI